MAEHLGSLIRRGILRPADRLPPSRRLARHLGLSRAVVVRAYGRLAAEGLVETRVGAGTFVRPPARPDGGAAPAPRFDWPAFLAGGTAPPSLPVFPGPDPTACLDLSRAVPDPELAPVRAIRRALRALAGRLGPEALDYATPWGHEPLRRHLHEDLALEGIEDEPLLVNGSQQALDLVARLVLRPGDVVALERPGYPGAFRVFRAAGARLLGLPLDGEGVRPDDLAAALRNHPVRLVYLTPSFQNPTGRTMGLDRRREILRLVQRAGVPLVEDGCFRELHFERPPPPALKSLDRDGLVLHVGSYAKSLLPGLRVGWVAAPRLVAERLAALRQDADLGSVTLAQMLTAELLARGVLSRQTERLRSLYRERRDALADALREALPPTCRVLRPAGGMSLWIRLPPGVDSLQAAARAAAHGVLVAPGALFDPDGADPGGLRVAFAAAPPARLAEAARRLGAALRELSPTSDAPAGRAPAGWQLPLV